MAEEQNNDNFNRFRQIQPGDRDQQRYRVPDLDDVDDAEEFHEFRNNQDLLEDDEFALPEQPEHRQLPPQPRLADIGEILADMDVDNDVLAPLNLVNPPPVPEPNADRDYLANLNDAFGQLNVANLIRPPPPVVRQPVYKLPATGVDTTKHLVRHQIQVSKLLAQQQQTLNNLLFFVGNPDIQEANMGAVRNSAARATQVALGLKAQAIHFQANMQRAAHVTDRYSTTPTMPVWNDIPRDAPMGRPCDIIAACGKFDPKTPDADFGIVWDNLRFYGTNLRFRENNYRMALSYLLEGEAKRIFHDHMDLNPIPPLSAIVDTLYKAYAKPRSTIDDKQALKDVVRQANEPLQRCIARGTIAIDRQRYMHDQREWPVLRKNLIRELVYQVVEPPTQKYINWLENDSIATTGIVCDVDRLIEMVDQEEKRHGWIPKVPKQVVFQAASTGIFRNPPRTDNPRHHHNKGAGRFQRPNQQPMQQPRPPQQHQPQQRPQMQQPRHHRPPTSQHHLQKPPHQSDKGFSKNVHNFNTFKTNATDFDGDDTMTGRDSFRGRGKKRPYDGKHRAHSAEAGKNRSRPPGPRDSGKKGPRRSSHSPASGYRSKPKHQKPWYKDKDFDYDQSNSKSRKNPPSQNQSGSKNVIVRVDTADMKGNFILDKNSKQVSSSIKPTYVIKGPGSEN